MSAALQVDPGVYGAASSILGVLAAGSARSAGGGVVELLSSQGGMAGSDPAGVRWAEGFVVREPVLRAGLLKGA